jgi:nicotinamide riboside kinase
MKRIYIVVSWVDHRARGKAGRSSTREYGTASTKQAAIRLAERVLPPDAEYIVTTIYKTVHQGRTPKLDRDLGRGL